MIKVDGVEVRNWKFPAGEVGVQVEDRPYFDFKVSAWLSDSDSILQLMNVRNALENIDPTRECTLDLKYLPYAQQDRVCEPGESLSVKVMANIINSLNFSEVTVWDCHSDVGVALIDRCVHIPVWRLFKMHHAWHNLRHHIKQGTVLVSPDAGANKKVRKVAQVLGGAKMITADKTRDTKTGEITGTYLNIGEMGEYCQQKHFLIIDDICVGGGTFIPLAQELKANGANTVNLYVTHGIFSRGVQTLIDGGIDWVYCSTSRDHSDAVRHHEKLTILEE